MENIDEKNGGEGAMASPPIISTLEEKSEEEVKVTHNSTPSSLVGNEGEGAQAHQAQVNPDPHSLQLPPKKPRRVRHRRNNKGKQQPPLPHHHICQQDEADHDQQTSEEVPIPILTESDVSYSASPRLSSISDHHHQQINLEGEGIARDDTTHTTTDSADPPPPEERREWPPAVLSSHLQTHPSSSLPIVPSQQLPTSSKQLENRTMVSIHTLLAMAKENAMHGMRGGPSFNHFPSQFNPPSSVSTPATQLKPSAVHDLQNETRDNVDNNWLRSSNSHHLGLQPNLNRPVSELNPISQSILNSAEQEVAESETFRRAFSDHFISFVTQGQEMREETEEEVKLEIEAMANAQQATIFSHLSDSESLQMALQMTLCQEGECHQWQGDEEGRTTEEDMIEPCWPRICDEDVLEVLHFKTQPIIPSPPTNEVRVEICEDCGESQKIISDFQSFIREEKMDEGETNLPLPKVQHDEATAHCGTQSVMEIFQVPEPEVSYKLYEDEGNENSGGDEKVSAKTVVLPGTSAVKVCPAQEAESLFNGNEASIMGDKEERLVERESMVIVHQAGGSISHEALLRLDREWDGTESRASYCNVRPTESSQRIGTPSSTSSKKSLLSCITVELIPQPTTHTGDESMSETLIAKGYTGLEVPPLLQSSKLISKSSTELLKESDKVSTVLTDSDNSEEEDEKIEVLDPLRVTVVKGAVVPESNSRGKGPLRGVHEQVDMGILEDDEEYEKVNSRKDSVREVGGIRVEDEESDSDQGCCANFIRNRSKSAKKKKVAGGQTEKGRRSASRSIKDRLSSVADVARRTFSKH